ncbi:protein disulfide-isomerase A1 [Vigna unguiculata]|uniref:Protein disulfide-isomerase A1 n=1 Tax=Vigna unguiculata TaxID=3917 RepID=A0A4D6LFK3_VIGUN|nr:protein disulfide-isomerase A1 [Vigna unguiculata]
MISATELKSVDFYRNYLVMCLLLTCVVSRKILRGLTEARLSIVAVPFMMLLFGMEPSYLTVSASTSVIVDKSSDHHYLRNFNNSFPEVSYEFASTDVGDMVETERINIEKTVLKFSSDSNSGLTSAEFRSDTITNVVKHDGEVDGESVEGSFSLTTHNFDNYVYQFPITVVNFYTPWCSWCQRLEPAWDKTTKIMIERYDPEIDGRIILAKVDCTLEADLCRRKLTDITPSKIISDVDFRKSKYMTFGNQNISLEVNFRKHHVEGYPSIRVFREGSDETHRHHTSQNYVDFRKLKYIREVKIYHRKSTSESQNISSEVDFRKSKCITRSRLPEIKMYHRKSKIITRSQLPEVKKYSRKSTSGKKYMGIMNTRPIMEIVIQKALPRTCRAQALPPLSSFMHELGFVFNGEVTVAKGGLLLHRSCSCVVAGCIYAKRRCCSCGRNVTVVVRLRCRPTMVIGVSFSTCVGAVVGEKFFGDAAAAVNGGLFTYYAHSG